MLPANTPLVIAPVSVAQELPPEETVMSPLSPSARPPLPGAHIQEDIKQSARHWLAHAAPDRR